MELEDLKKRQEYYRAKAFRMIIEIAFIFGIPAAVAFWGGRQLDEMFQTGKTLQLISLAVAFAVSWVILLVKWKKLDRQLRTIDEDIKKETEKMARERLLKPRVSVEKNDRGCNE
jgi:hypothetical protein